MHTIQIEEVAEGVFNVLSNGFSYKVHQGLDAKDAAKRAAELKTEFKRIGQRARIVTCTCD